jgi:hypothetical protein
MFRPDRRARELTRYEFAKLTDIERVPPGLLERLQKRRGIDASTPGTTERADGVRPGREPARRLDKAVADARRACRGRVYPLHLERALAFANARRTPQGAVVRRQPVTACDHVHLSPLRRRRARAPGRPVSARRRVAHHEESLMPGHLQRRAPSHRLGRGRHARHSPGAPAVVTSPPSTLAKATPGHFEQFFVEWERRARAADASRTTPVSAAARRAAARRRARDEIRSADVIRDRGARRLRVRRASGGGRVMATVLAFKRRPARPRCSGTSCASTASSPAGPSSASPASGRTRCRRRSGAAPAAVTRSTSRPASSCRSASTSSRRRRRRSSGSCSRPRRRARRGVMTENPVDALQAMAKRTALAMVARELEVLANGGAVTITLHPQDPPPRRALPPKPTKRRVAVARNRARSRAPAAAGRPSVARSSWPRLRRRARPREGRRPSRNASQAARRRSSCPTRRGASRATTPRASTIRRRGSVSRGAASARCSRGESWHGRAARSRRSGSS